MKQKQYSIHLTCNAHQYSKIQRAIRTIIPPVTKEQRLINQYGNTFKRLINKGFTAKDIYNVVKNTRTDDQEPIKQLDVYKVIHAMGYKLKYTLSSKK